MATARDAKGRYALLFELETSVEVEVGALGRLAFPAGHYAYSGSALAGLRHRLARHSRRSKVLRWHVDTLTVLPSCHIQGAVVFPPDGPGECDVVHMLCESEDARVWPPRFGASDHRCPGHLVHLGDGDAAVGAAMTVLTAPGVGGEWWPLKWLSRPGG